jgi:hypothetical protein
LHYKKKENVKALRSVNPPKKKKEKMWWENSGCFVAIATWRMEGGEKGQKSIKT